MSAPRSLVACLLLLAAAPAHGHHGVAAPGLAGPEGPGAALETPSALPLAEGGLLAMAKEEYVSYRRFAFAEPENKTFASYTTLALGWGITSWLSAWVFQPFAVKAQDGLGRSAGAGDTNLALSLGLKWDEGLALVPPRESLDDLEDWHFSLWASCTLPVGSTTRADARGDPFSPDMQPGFGAPSPALGLAALKQLGPAFTWLAAASAQYFFPSRAPGGRYQFGAEARLDTALVFRALSGDSARLDLAAELNGLSIRRDREEDAAGTLQPLPASGGSVVYAGLGARLFLGRFSAALAARFPALADLNEQSLQQGSEGLERFRGTLALSWSGGP